MKDCFIFSSFELAKLFTSWLGYFVLKTCKDTFFSKTYLVLWIFMILSYGSKVQAQSSPSGQAKFVVPSSISACNSDTICIEVMNNRGQKGITYTGNVTLEVDIPGGALMKYIDNSVFSLPAGAGQVSYAANKLTMSVPLPALGATTRVCFVVVADCNISSIIGLPHFSGKISYPSGFPTPMENFTSISMNVGVGNLYIREYSSYFGPSATNAGSGRAQGTTNYSVLFFGNTGYGDITNVRVTRTVDNALNANSGLFTASNPGWDQPGSSGEIISTINNGTQTTTVFSMTSTNANGLNLGPDRKLAAGQANDRLMQTTFIAPNQCGTWEIKYVLEWLCADGSPSCQAPQTFIDVVTIGAGTPKLAAVLNSSELPDGCPNKHIQYTITNNGVGNASPVGNAYDVDFNINLGAGLIQMSNLTLNGIAVPASAITTAGIAANNFKINLKDINTLAYGGLTDLDADGFMDDMLVGASVVVDFDYTIPCTEACGANMFNSLSANNTFTDFCRTLKGATNTPLLKFGFEQVRPLQQTTPTPDYGVWADAMDTKTKTAKYNFQYKQHNLNLAAATAKLIINYSAKMEVNPNTILLNGVAPTNAPVLMGSQAATPAYGPVDGNPIAGTPAPFGAYPDIFFPTYATDTDSAYVIDLTAAELAAMFDNIPDSLHYNSTYYGCGKRQNQNNGDNWQLLVSLQPVGTLCNNGSAPCTFDLACKKPYSYSAGQGCGSKPCFISDMQISRVEEIGATDISLATAAGTPDLAKSYEGDIVQIRMGNFITAKSTTPLLVGEYTGASRWQDGRWYFTINYSAPKGWNANYTIFDQFVEAGSEVVIRSYTPHPTNKLLLGTVGAPIFTAPIQLSDYREATVNSATNLNTFNVSSALTLPATIGSPAWYCANQSTSWVVGAGFICPASNTIYNSGSNNISTTRRFSEDGTKVSEQTALIFAEALERAGYTGDLGDPNIYIEIKQNFRMNKDFLWDNSNDWKIVGGFEHYGNGPTVNFFSPSSTRYSGCNLVQATHLTVTKDHRVDDPKSVYSSDCGLTVHNKIGYRSFNGDYFENGEVRVPYKVEKIEINIPSEYSIVSGTTSLTTAGCNGVSGYTAIANSAPNGLVTFTNTGSGVHTYSDMPRIDDCAGTGNLYTTVFDLQYDLVKIGSAAPTVYKMPIKIYTIDEFGNSIILLDTASISEAVPDLTLSPLENILRPTDGGACQPSFFDFKIQNNTLFDAPNSYFAAEVGVGITSIVDITDGGNTYIDPIDAGDKSMYGGTNMFVKLGTVNAGDIRIVRVFVNTSVCSGDIDVFADYGCEYPSPLQPNLSSSTLKQATTMFEAKAPKILSKPLTTCVDIIDLCGEKEVEFEIRNADLPNLYNMLAGIKLPASMSYVAGSVQIKHPAATGTYTTIGAVTATGSDSITINFSGANPFNTPCGLTGSDTTTLNDVRVKFKFTFNSCPLTTVEQIKFRISAENFCGTPSYNYAVMPINYLGSAGVVNDYSYTETTEIIQMCAANGQIQNISDVIQVNNLGGHGSLSGPSSGNDSLTLAIFIDLSKFNISNIVVGAPFGPATISVDPQGNPTVSVRVPAGIAVGASLNMPISYDVTPRINQLCSAVAAPANICYFGSFSRRITLNCPGGLDCSNSLPKLIIGTGASFRNFECCCDINLSALQNMECLDNGTPTKITDNMIRFGVSVTNTDQSLTTFNITVNGGTTVTPAMGTYGSPLVLTLGAGTGGSGSTFMVTFTDSTNPNCTETVNVVDPGNCMPANPADECPTPKCGTVMIQVNGN